MRIFLNFINVYPVHININYQTIHSFERSVWHILLAHNNNKNKEFLLNFFLLLYESLFQYSVDVTETIKSLHKIAK